MTRMKNYLHNESLQKLQPLLRTLLFGISLILAAAVIVRGITFGSSGPGLSVRMTNIVSSVMPDEELVQMHVETTQPLVQSLKKRNMFTPPMPSPQPPACLGIFGDGAIINGKLYKVGDEVAGARILAIGPTDVTILWEENEKKLVPFSVPVKYAPAKKTSSAIASAAEPGRAADFQVQEGQAVEVRVGSMPGQGQGGRGGSNVSMDEIRGMRDRFQNMSPEERDRAIQEMRSRFGGGGSGSGGFNRGSERGSDSGRRRN